MSELESKIKKISESKPEPKLPHYFWHPWPWEVRKKYMHIPDELPFMMEEYEDRLKRTREMMKKQGLDCLFILASIGDRGPVRWLANVYETVGLYNLIVPLEGELVLTTTASSHGEPIDSYVVTSIIKDTRASVPYPSCPSLTDHAKNVLTERKLTDVTVGLVPGRRSLDYNFYTGVQKALPKVKWVNVDEEYMRVRAVKSPAELEVLREISRMTDVGMEAAFEAMKPGATELEVATAFECMVRKEGMHTVGNLFDTRVVAGPRAGFKNVMPTSRKMHPGDMVYIDISTMYKGYCNDAGLSTCVGKPPTKEKETILETAVLMNEAITNVTKPGVQCNALVEVAREVARENGFPGPYGDFYDVTAGHGMGICQKEMPQINTQCTDKLLPNMYFAIESMIGKVGVGCGCCESSLAVTETGSERYMLFDRRPWLKK